MRTFLLNIVFILLGFTFEQSFASLVPTVEYNINSEIVDSEQYICTVVAVNSWSGKSTKLDIYRVNYGKVSFYKAVEQGGNLSGRVYLVEGENRKQYKYYAKIGFTGVEYFNTDKIRL